MRRMRMTKEQKRRMTWMEGADDEGQMMKKEQKRKMK